MHRERMRKVSNIVLTALLSAVLFAASGGTAAAALPAPNWMPGSPILAGNQVILLWTPVPGAVKYIVYLSGTKVQESVSIQAIVTAPEDAGSFEYQIAAVDAQAAEGAKSASGTIKIFKLTPPKGLEGRVVGKNVALHWEAVGGAVLYNLYRSTESGKNFQLVDSVQDLRFTDSKAEENKKYYYRVTAKDASGKESEPGKELLVSTAMAQVTAGKSQNVIGKKAKMTFTVKDKDFQDAGPVRIDGSYDLERLADGSRYFLTSVNTRTVVIFDGDGKFIKEFGAGEEKDKALDGFFKTPAGIGVSRDGRVYVVDAAKNNVQIFSSDGVFERVFTTVTKQEWMTFDPRLSDVAIDANGDVYILEYNNAAVIKYSVSGKVLSYFRKRGLPKGDETGYLAFFKVVGDRILLGDGARGRVMVTDQAGKVLKTVGVKGAGVGMFAMMGGFDVGDDGLVYMVDRQTGLVQVYKLEDGKYQFTMADEKNTAPLPVFTPVTLSVYTPKQRLVVANGLSNEVRAFEMFGQPEEAGKQ